MKKHLKGSKPFFQMHSFYAGIHTDFAVMRGSRIHTDVSVGIHSITKLLLTKTTWLGGCDVMTEINSKVNLGTYMKVSEERLVLV